jgi:hypothetical protein
MNNKHLKLCFLYRVISIFNYEIKGMRIDTSDREPYKESYSQKYNEIEKNLRKLEENMTNALIVSKNTIPVHELFEKNNMFGIKLHEDSVFIKLSTISYNKDNGQCYDEMNKYIIAEIRSSELLRLNHSSVEKELKSLSELIDQINKNIKKKNKNNNNETLQFQNIDLINTFNETIHKFITKLLDGYFKSKKVNLLDKKKLEKIKTKLIKLIKIHTQPNFESLTKDIEYNKKDLLAYNAFSTLTYVDTISKEKMNEKIHSAFMELQPPILLNRYMDYLYLEYFKQRISSATNDNEILFFKSILNSLLEDYKEYEFQITISTNNMKKKIKEFPEVMAIFFFTLVILSKKYKIDIDFVKGDDVLSEIDLVKILFNINLIKKNLNIEDANLNELFKNYSYEISNTFKKNNLSFFFTRPMNMNFESNLSIEDIKYIIILVTSIDIKNSKMLLETQNPNIDLGKFCESCGPCNLTGFSENKVVYFRNILENIEKKEKKKDLIKETRKYLSSQGNNIGVKIVSNQTHEIKEEIILPDMNDLKIQENSIVTFFKFNNSNNEIEQKILNAIPLEFNINSIVKKNNQDINNEYNNLIKSATNLTKVIIDGMSDNSKKWVEKAVYSSDSKLSTLKIGLLNVENINDLLTLSHDKDINNQIRTNTIKQMEFSFTISFSENTTLIKNFLYYFALPLAFKSSLETPGSTKLKLNFKNLSIKDVQTIKEILKEYQFSLNGQNDSSKFNNKLLINLISSDENLKNQNEFLYEDQKEKSSIETIYLNNKNNKIYLTNNL